MPRFDGRVAFVTGGATGIGLACARAVVEGGGRVMLAARREDVLASAAAGLGASAAYVPCDVTSDASVDAAVAAVMAGIGMLACWIPALRAARIDPAHAIRTN